MYLKHSKKTAENLIINIENFIEMITANKDKKAKNLEQLEKINTKLQER